MSLQAAPRHPEPARTASSPQKASSGPKATSSATAADTAAAEPTTDDAAYAYDAAGRLVGVTDPDGQTARYHYDEAGNRLGIDRYASSTLSVLSIVPVRAAPGAKVTLSGTGFSPTAAGNTVTFGGKAASVISASATRVVVTVPADAVSGKVAVAVGGASAEAPESFTVPAAPAITKVEPSSGVAGTDVTLTGSGFAPSISDNVVRFNGGTFAEMVSATDTTLTVRVPPGAATTGKITVQTPDGKATSPGDFTIPLSGADDFETTVRASVTGDAVSAAVTTSGKRARVLFDADQGQSISVGFAQSTFTSTPAVTLVDPRGDSVGSTGYIYTGSSDYEVRNLPVSGTYSLVIDPPSTATGAALVTVSQPVGGALSFTDAPIATTMNRTGQDGAWTFDAVKGDSFSVGIDTAGMGDTTNVRLYAPNQDQLNSLFVSKAYYTSLDIDALPATGTYTLYLDPSNAATGTATVTISHYASASDLTTDGDAVPLGITRPGQDGTASFSATAGQKISLGVTSTAFSSYVTCAVYAPDGTKVDSFIVSANSTAEWDSTALPQSGTYRLRTSPDRLGTGTLVATLSRPADIGRLTTSGDSASASVTRLGQNAEATFTASAGDDLSLGFTDNTFTTTAYVDVIAPSGAKIVTSAVVSAGSALTKGLSDLAETGTYTVVLDPYQGAVGSLKMTLSADVTVNVSVDGSSVAATATRPGQRIRAQFTDPAADFIGVGLTSNTVNQTTYINLIGPAGGSGTFVTSVVKNTTQAIHLHPVTPGTAYTLLLEPQSAGSGAVTLWLSSPLTAGALSASGTTGTISRPGQQLEYTLAAAAGDGASVTFGNTTLTGTTTIQSLAPGASDPAYLGILSTSDVDLKAPLSAGTYRLLLQPAKPVTGSTTATLVPDLNAGALSVDGTARSATLTTTGQNARFTFAGTAGQKLTLTVSGTPPDAWYLSVYGPDAKWLVSDRYMSTTTTSYALTALPSSGTYTLTLDPAAQKTGTFSLGLSTTATLASSPGDDAGAAGTLLPDKAKTVRVSTSSDSGSRVDAGTAPDGGGSVPRGTDAWQPDKHNLAGQDWVTRRSAAPKAPAALRAPPGQTSLTGQVRKLDGAPLAGVSVRVGVLRARTDAQGRFLLAGISPHATTLTVDGSTATTGARAYGRFDIRIHPRADESTDLGFPVWMTPLDTKHTVTFDAPAKKDITLTTPQIPGLEVRIPKGSVVRDENGDTVTELGITAIPIDRPPFPLPKNSVVPVYFTVQPGGTYVFPEGAQIIYPNYTHEPPGTRVDFMDYDPKGKGWYVYGHGQVSADGTQIVPDKKTRVWAFHGAMFNISTLPSWATSWLDDAIDWLSGDPVDLSTGLLTDSRTDLAVDDQLTPIEVTRTYWQGDTASRAFGIGRDLIYNAFLHSEEQYQEVDLYVPGGQKVHYVRTSAGTGYADAVFQPQAASGRFRGTVIKYHNAVWEMTFPDGTVWAFPQYAPLKEIRDRYGNALTITRADDTRGPVTRVMTSAGRWISFSYDSSNRVTSATDNSGRSVSYGYDSAGRLQTVTDPAGKVSSYTYDGTSNRIATAKDARDIVYMTNTYDDAGRVKHQTLTEGQAYSFAYTTTGTGEITATEVTRPGGAVRRVEFDSGYGTKDTEAYGTSLARATLLERGTGHRVDAVTDPYQRRTELHYDTAGNLTGAVELAGTDQARSIGTIAYDGPFDQPSSITDALGHTTQLAYDAAGNLVTFTDAAGRQTLYTYTDTGLLKTATDNSHAVTTYTYSNGDLTSVTDAEGRTSTQYTDSAGRPSVLTDEAGSRTAVSYDKLNQPRTLTDPLDHTTVLGYDNNGNLTSLTDPRQNTTTWSYDDADRPESATDPLGVQALFAYDDAGFLDKATNRSGLTAKADYDLLGRLKTVQYGVDDLGHAQSTVGYGYDDKDRLRQITDSQTGDQTFAYDAYDRTTSTAGPTGTVDYTYDAADRRTQMTAAGTTTTYGYDNSDVLTSIASGSQEVDFGLDTVGREKTASLPGGITRTTGYDATGIVTSIAYTRGSTPIGNLAYTRDQRTLQTGLTGSLAKVALPAAESGTQFGKDNRITSYDGRAFTYDADGQLTGDGLRTYGWNARGELTGVTQAGGAASSFGYDALGGRVSKTTGTATSRYLTDGSNPLVEQDGSGTTTATVATSGLDDFLTRTEAGTTQVYLTDALGSVVGLANTDGSVATTYAYDPNGTTTAAGTASSNPHTYTGREDDGTGLLYYRNRYYDPQTGRFISQDPIGQAGGSNLYQYALSSPTTYTDPSGKNPLIAACVIGGVVDGGLDWLTQRLSGRKVNWGQVGIAAATGCLAGMLGEGLGTIASDARAGSRLGQCAVPNSFTGDTPVLMADGTHKPIRDLGIGDRVIATDPATGESGPRTVTALIQGSGDKQLVDVTLDTDGPTGSKTSTVTATDGHPFWVPRLHQWVDAGDLQAGQWLQTSSGTWVQITAIRRHTEQTTVYNLTVDGLHTYYVLAGTTPLLVHNCGVDPAAVNPDFTTGAVRNADGTWTIPEDSPLYRPPGKNRVGSGRFEGRIELDPKKNPQTRTGEATEAITRFVDKLPDMHLPGHLPGAG
ncbi:RHS repeat-associated core domain-containing protein [Streptomyces sp. NPDC048278]|uniref:RHS repeat-associated core domain-containing protein n=1 Tax=Streptomyces sp. NPDC048278 TaxID=3155809 RepID=UPI0034121FA5